MIEGRVVRGAASSSGGVARGGRCGGPGGCADDGVADRRDGAAHVAVEVAAEWAECRARGRERELGERDEVGRARSTRTRQRGEVRWMCRVAAEKQRQAVQVHTAGVRRGGEATESEASERSADSAATRPARRLPLSSSDPTPACQVSLLLPSRTPSTLARPPGPPPCTPPATCRPRLVPPGQTRRTSSTPRLAAPAHPRSRTTARTLCHTTVPRRQPLARRRERGTSADDPERVRRDGLAARAPSRATRSARKRARWVQGRSRMGRRTRRRASERRAGRP